MVLLTCLALVLSWPAAAQPDEQAHYDASAGANPRGEAATLGNPEGQSGTQTEAEPESKPKAKAKKKAKTKKETAEERYQRSKYFAIMPSEGDSVKFRSEGRASGAPVKKKGKKGVAVEKKACARKTAGITCAAGDDCGCCERRLDCEELPDCVWHPHAGGRDAPVQGLCAEKPEGS
ncbi:MAG: hypothetical protein WC943_15780 [Elusimicrobiota bacterium]